MGRFAVIYASETGNTEMVAREIYEAIRSDSKELLDVRNFDGRLESDVYFIGYWVNHSTCSLEIMDLLGSLHGKHVALFGTCGIDDSEHYYQRLERNVIAFLPEDNNYLGAFYCRGKMPPQIRERYEEARGTYEDDILNRMLQTYDEALSHPDRQDLLQAHLFVDEVFKSLGIR
ncbi:MAG: flavodoxin domain-containing protein [Lachnospiraceae bacterium]|nr:flavodoxin domain-containing protein [Lachnospiraceae bacterium]